jgi:phospholipase/carboxylesterase
VKLGVAALAGAGCNREVFDNVMTPDRTTDAHGYGEGRLRARPVTALTGELASGRQALGIVTERDVMLWVPDDYRPDQPGPLVVMLHGAGGNGEGALDILSPDGEPPPFLVLAPSSRASTWDALVGGFGPDVEVLDRALAHVFVRAAVDPARVAVGGFSDGASYALGLGLANGDLFGRVVAFSPGFIPAGPAAGKPQILVTHGVHDDVLPIDSTSRRLVPRLRRAGHDVDYREFDGGHEIPASLVRDSLAWVA